MAVTGWQEYLCLCSGVNLCGICVSLCVSDSLCKCGSLAAIQDVVIIQCGSKHNDFIGCSGSYSC